MQDIEDLYPLTSAQEGMLFHTTSDPKSGVYVEQVHFFLSGQVEPKSLREVWEVLLKRHPVLRTAFLWEGLDNPLQAVKTDPNLPWEELDWSTLSPEQRASQWKELLSTDRRQGFELEIAPLLRVRLLRFTAQAWRCMVTFHHILMDGWSFHSLIDEFFHEYQSRITERAWEAPSRPNFREVVAFRESHSTPGEEAFWRARFQDFEPSRLQSHGVTGETQMREREVWLPEEATSALTRLCKESRVTLSTLVQSAWGLLLSVHCQATDLAFGVTMSGRGSQPQGSERILGPLLNVLPLRLKVPSETTLADWLTQLQELSLQFQEYQYSSLPQIQSWSGVSAGEPLFESLLVFENYPTKSTEWSGFEVSGLNFREQSNYPLALLVVPGKNLRFIFIASGTEFSEQALEALSRQFLALVQQMSTGFHLPVGDYSLLGEPESTTLADWGTGATLENPQDVIEVFQAKARENPEQPAVISGHERLTYAELDEASNRLAVALIDKGATPGDSIGVFLERSPGMLIALLGILKSGCAYVPLPQQHPQQSLRSIMERSGIRLIISEPHLISTLPLEGREWLTPRAKETAADFHPVPGPLAYVLFTSGSTGKPKGVKISRTNLAHSNQARLEYYKEDPWERFLLLSSLGFDSSVAGLFGTLTYGGTLVLPAQGEERDPFLLLELIQRHRVTHTLCLPTLWGALLEQADPFQVASLRTVILAGEACPATLVEEHYGILPESLLCNEYGPTEATVWCSAYRISPDFESDSVPIGQPIPGTFLELQDIYGRPVPVGVAGELVVGGAGVAVGYLESSQESPFFERDGTALYRTGDQAWWDGDGNLRFAGRRDSQLKVRGYRIEAAAVESVLREHPGLKDVAVACPDGRRLVAYVVGDVEHQPLKDLARSKLPEYAVPTQFQALDELPRTRTGKLDRLALPEPGQVQTGFLAPRTANEKLLASIWSEVLDADEVGIHDDFFELGGDSILSIRIVSKARAAGLDLNPQELLSYPTIARLAPKLSQTQTHEEAGPEGDFALTPIQSWFLRGELAHPHHWNVSYWFQATQPLEQEKLQRSLDKLVRRHDAFQLSFNRGRQRLDQDVSSPRLSWHRCDHLDEGGRNALEEELQGGFSLTQAPLLLAAVLDDGHSHQLLLAAHHLVVDYLSWPQIIVDLEKIYQDRELAPLDTRYWQWAQYLEQRARTQEIQDQIPFWCSQQGGELIPTDFAEGRNDEANALMFEHRVSLGPQRTRQSGPDIQSWLLGGFALALQRCFALNSLRIGVESHGRDDSGLNVSHTVGWFADFFPLLLRLEPDSSGKEAAEHTDSLFSQLPQKGRGYGLLRHICETETLQEPEPQVMMTYLGRFGSWQETELFDMIAGPSPRVRHRENERRFLIELFARLEGDTLVIEWRYGSQVHREETIKKLGANLESALEEITCKETV